MLCTMVSTSVYTNILGCMMRTLGGYVRVNAREGYTADQVAAWFLRRTDWGQHPVSGDIWTWQVEQVRIWATSRMRAVLAADN